MNISHFVVARLVPFGVLCCLCPAIAANAQNVITFDSIAGMSNSPGAPIPVASQVSNQFASEGVVFSSGSGASFVGVVQLGPNHAVSGLNGIGGATIGGDLNYLGDPLIVAHFVNPADGVTPWVTSFVSVQGDEMPDGSTISMRAYGIGGNLIDTVTATDTGGTLLSLSDPGIAHVEITGSGTVAYDNFTFNPVTPPLAGAATAPEPGSMVLFMSLSLPIVGVVARRRNALANRAAK